MGVNDRIAQEALDWVIRLAERDFADWDRFEAWLTADPAHGEAYWPMAEADREIAAALRPEASASVIPLARRQRPRWRSLAGWSIAASVAAAAAGFALLRPAANGQLVVETPPGAMRTVSLPDGTQIALNGASRLVLDGAGGRRARLDRGEAAFAIRHDPRRPFTLAVAGAQVVDVGTSFNVVREGGRTRLAVGEGAVRFELGRQARTLTAGQTLSIADGTDRIVFGSVDPSFVSGWRMHRLAYDRAPLRVVVADLGRATGVEIGYSAGLAHRTFTGTVSTGGAKDDPVVRFAAMMDVEAKRRGNGWVLTER